MALAPDDTQPRYVEVEAGSDARRIAYLTSPGDAPTVVWLGGYRSDMRGTKAEHLAGFCRDADLGFCRLDYSGHGASSGRFEDGTISRWLDDARVVLREATRGPLILVGSSMGAWIALRLVDEWRREGKSEAVGLLLLAPAPDFTHRLVAPDLSAIERELLDGQGFIDRASAYSPEPDIYTRALFEDGERNLVMEDLIETGCPVHVIQGMADTDVPFRHALDLVTLLPSDGVVLTLVRDGDHRLSRPEDLARMGRAVRDLVEAWKSGS